MTPKPTPMAPRSRMTGIRWPAIAGPGDAQVLALQFQFEQTQWWPESRLLAHQMAQIQNLLDHAAGTVPFYRERLAPFRGLEPETLTLETYRQVPLLSRTDIQRAGEDLVSRNIPRQHGKMFDVRTSGSTGRPITVKGTAITGLFLEALTLRGHVWHKRDFSAKNVTFRLRVPKIPAGARQVWAAGYATGPAPVLDITQPVAVERDRAGGVVDQVLDLGHLVGEQPALRPPLGLLELKLERQHQGLVGGQDGGPADAGQPGPGHHHRRGSVWPHAPGPAVCRDPKLGFPM